MTRKQMLARRILSLEFLETIMDVAGPRPGEGWKTRSVISGVYAASLVSLDL
jgi:hypothetical protein